MNAIIKELKRQGEDYEFYPTTREIIEAMYWDIKKQRTNWKGKYEYMSVSILDIGAGNGKLLTTLKEISKSQYQERERHENAKQLGISKYLVIEKSQILLNHLPEEALPIGTDFHESTLIDKQSDIVFCNPPYSEYAQWATKIIREANTEAVYLVIPNAGVITKV